MVIGIFIGMVTFIGSIIACVKLNGKKLHVPSHPALTNAILLVICLILMVLSGLSSYYDSCVRTIEPGVLPFGKWGWIFILLLVVFSSIYGVYFVLPIGGADMPVVISVLNAFPGLSGCTAGFIPVSYTHLTLPTI